MGIRNAIKQPSMPAHDDLEGWKNRVASLERELGMARAIVVSLEGEQKEAHAEPDDGVELNFISHPEIGPPPEAENEAQD